MTTTTEDSNPFEEELDKWDKTLRQQKREKIQAEQVQKARLQAKQEENSPDNLLNGKILNTKQIINATTNVKLVAKQATLKVQYPNNPLCDACGCVMLERANGDTGQKFWGCSNFPHCRNTMQMHRHR